MQATMAGKLPVALMFWFALSVLFKAQAVNGDDHYYDSSCSDVPSCVCYFETIGVYVADCYDPEMTSIPDNLAFNITSLKVVGTAVVSVTREDLSPYRYLTAIDFSSNNITTIENSLLDAYTDLELFKVGGNSLSVLDTNLFTNNRQLREYDASNNLLTQTPSLSGLGSLESVNLASNKLASLPSSYFQGCTNVITLSLSDNLINSLGPDMFGDLSQLKQLELSTNKLSSLSDNSFRGLTSLTEAYIGNNEITSVGASLFPNSQGTANILDLSDNLLTTINENAFTTLTNLDSLDLAGNSFTTIPAALQDLNGLTKLDLSRNQFSNLGPNTFSSLSTLNELFLSGMPTLVSLDNAAFHGLPNLQRLSLSENPGLTEFTEDNLSPFETPQLSSLYIDRCSFVYLSESTFSQFDELNLVDLYGNRLNCSCELKWMPRVVEDGVQWASHWYDSSTPPTCFTPTHLLSYPIPTMQEEDMTCDKLQMERASPAYQTINIKRNMNFTAHLYIGLPDSLWIAPDNSRIMPYRKGETPLGLRRYATYELIEETNAMEAVFFVNNASTFDQGVYTLVATNIVGNDSMTFELEVIPFEATLPPITEGEISGSPTTSHQQVSRGGILLFLVVCKLFLVLMNGFS